MKTKEQILSELKSEGNLTNQIDSYILKLVKDGSVKFNSFSELTISFDDLSVMIFGIVSETIIDTTEVCAKLCEKSDRYRGDYFANLIRDR